MNSIIIIIFNFIHTELDDYEDWDNWAGDFEENEGPHCDDPNFNVNALYIHM